MWINPEIWQKALQLNKSLVGRSDMFPIWGTIRLFFVFLSETPNGGFRTYECSVRVHSARLISDETGYGQILVDKIQY